MRNHYKDSKNNVNTITRYLPQEDFDKAIDGGCQPNLDEAGNVKSRTRNGDAQFQVIVFDNLEIEIAESLKEAKEIDSDDYIYNSYCRQKIVDITKENVDKKFSAIGIKSVREVKIKKALIDSTKNVFELSGGELDEDGNVVKACTLGGVKYDSLEELYKVIK